MSWPELNSFILRQKYMRPASHHISKWNKQTMLWKYAISRDHFEHKKSSPARKTGAMSIIGSNNVISCKLTDQSYTQRHYCCSGHALTHPKPSRCTRLGRHCYQSGPMRPMKPMQPQSRPVECTVWRDVWTNITEYNIHYTCIWHSQWLTNFQTFVHCQLYKKKFGRYLRFMRNIQGGPNK